MSGSTERNNTVISNGGSSNTPVNSHFIEWKVVLPITIVVGLLCMPFAALFGIAVFGGFENIEHIVFTIIPGATNTTLVLMLLVGIIVAVVGTVSATLVSFYEFPGRRIFEWALMLPLAVPTYISAYAFVEFFAYTGPLQTLVRSLGGFESSRDYWFPEIRSVWGAAFVMGIVLYPYVYLAVRSVFALQAASIIDAARCLGADQKRVFVSVSLPLARPAIILGVSLALMETLNDIGAVEHMGVHTLTFSIFSVWLNQNDLAGAAQLSLFLLAIVVGLIIVERISRRGRQYHSTRMSFDGYSASKRIGLKSRTASLAAIACAFPIGLGFGIPILILSGYAIERLDSNNWSDLLQALVTTAALGLSAAVVAISIAMMMHLALREQKTVFISVMIRLASSGYAIPGTLVALGLLFPLAAFDNYTDGIMREWFGISTGLILTGTGIAMVFAYVVRFMTMAEGTISNGFAKLSPNLEKAGRNLGRRRHKVIRAIIIPLMKPTILSAGLLIFVEVVKELSATIMLRPFGMNTLATHVYDYASQARVEDASIGCLLIILVGMIPVIFVLPELGRK